MFRLKWLPFFCLLTFITATSYAQQEIRQVVFQEDFDGSRQASTLFKKSTSASGKFFKVSQSKQLTLPQITLPATGEKLILTFQSRFDSAQEYGIGHLRISNDGGNSWQLLHAVDGENAWQQTGTDLTRFASEKILLQFELFQLENGAFVPWEIDNIIVAEVAANANLALAGILDVNIKSLNANLFPFIFMNVTVDTNGTAFPDLQQADFVVCENDVPQTDLFQVTPPGSAGGSRLADIVFIVDNSGSLGDEQKAVNDNMIAFVDSLAASGVDFALGLCRYGASQGNGDPIIEDNGQLTTDADYFKNNVWARNVINGGREPGYFAIVQSATQFSFRPGAQRIFIIITDERADQDNTPQQDATNICLNNSISVYALIDQFFIDNNTDLTVVAQQTGGKAFNITDPFNTILDDIRGAVSNTYIVRYRSSQPVLDGVERIVKVVAMHNAEADTSFGKYTPGANPIIKRDSATVALSDQAWQQGTEFKITVIVTDAAEPFTQSVTLFYRTTNSVSFTSVPMVKQTPGNIAKISAVGDSSIWMATIPGNVANPPGVDYYVTATDGISTTSAPETNPQSSPFQIAVLPNKAPSVVHTPPANYQPGQTLDINTTIIDTTNKLASVTLNYRRVGDIIFQRVPMFNTGGDNYKETIPAAFLNEHGVEYFIRAIDDFGVSTIKFFAVFPSQGTAAVIVLQPNGGENWQVCSTQRIRWNATKVQALNIEYSHDGGANWTTLMTNQPASVGEYNWDIPASFTTDALVRITDASNLSITDASDNLFTISDFPRFQDWTSFHTCNTGLVENYIKAILVNCDGVVFIGTRDSGLLALDEQKNWFQYATFNSGIPSNSILSLALQGSDVLWVGTNGNGLAKFTENDWKTYDTNNGLPHNRIWAIAIDKKLNDVWIGTSDGVAKYNQSGFKVFKDELPNAIIYAIAIAPNGTIWFGTADGLLEYNGDTWKHYTFSNSGLLDRTVLALALDLAGRIWVGTAKGLNRFDGQNWVSYTPDNSSLPASSVRTIQIDNNDNKWIGTWGGGLAKLGNGWSVYQNGTSGLLDDYILSMFIDCNGYKWIGTENGGFTQFMGDPSVPVSVEDEALSRQPSAFNLQQNYPNPFNPSTMIKYQLAMNSDVDLSIYTVTGQLVRTLVRGQKAKGDHSVVWDAMDEAGKRVPSGVYVYRLKAGEFEFSRKLVVIK